MGVGSGSSGVGVHGFIAAVSGGGRRGLGDRSGRQGDSDSHRRGTAETAWTAAASAGLCVLPAASRPGQATWSAQAILEKTAEKRGQKQERQERHPSGHLHAA